MTPDCKCIIFGSAKVTIGDGAALPERNKCVASWGFMNDEDNKRRDQWCTDPKNCTESHSFNAGDGHGSGAVCFRCYRLLTLTPDHPSQRPRVTKPGACDACRTRDPDTYQTRVE